MSLIFNDSNFIQDVKQEAKIQQYVFYYQPNIQKVIIKNAIKIVVHCWGGGGGGGGSNKINNGIIVSGAGGGSAFTILDFPFYPFKDVFEIQVQVGKGGDGGKFIKGSYIEAEDGGNTIVKFLDNNQRIQKEFVSYGGGGGKGNSVQLVNGGNGGMNTIYYSISRTGGTGEGTGPETGGRNYKPLMGANYIGDSIFNFPRGGTELQVYGDHCQMNYLSVSGSGGGANHAVEDYLNHGGSFILNKGGQGGTSTGTDVRGGGGGSSYYGKGGDGGSLSMTRVLARGQDGEPNSGAGGGGSISFYTDSNFLEGGRGANGLAVIEVYY